MSFDQAYLLEDYKDFVSFMGLTGKCVECERFPVPTTDINGRTTCCTCAKDCDMTIYKYDKFDALFKCPASACGAEVLSLREFWIGTCCDAASRWKAQENIDASTDGEHMLKVIHNYYSDSKKTFKTAVTVREEISGTLYKSRGTVEKLKIAAIKAEEAAKIARKAADDAQQEHDAIKAKHEISRKRVRAAGEEYDSARKRFRFLTYEYDIVYEQSELNQDKPDKSCSICYENYVTPDRQESAIPWGHRFCYSCIKKCKQCPTCRKKFSSKGIIKLF